MKRASHYFLAAVAAFLSLCGQGRAEEAVEIKQHWIPGKVYSFTQTLDQEMEMSVGEQKMTQKGQSTQEFSFSVRKEGAKKYRRARWGR